MPIIGIDLGTSNSAAAILRGGRPVMIPSAEGITLGGKAYHVTWRLLPTARCWSANRHAGKPPPIRTAPPRPSSGE